MSFTANVFRVLIASPSDLTEERKVAMEAVYDWNAQHSEAESVVLLPVAWETHAKPRSNIRPQEAINQQLVDHSDILVGMFWTRLGTHTGVAESGTVEEIERFVADDKPALLYFSNRPVEPGKIDAKQNRRLKAFKESTQKTALVGSFDTLDVLRQTITRHLVSEVRSLKLNARGGASLPPAVASEVHKELAGRVEDQSLAVPSETWDRDKFERAMYIATHRLDEAQIERLDKAYRETKEYSEGDNAATWESFIEWARVHFGKGGQLRRLEKLAKDNPNSHQALFYLASVYGVYNSHERAADTHLLSAQAASDPETKALRLSNAVNQFSKAKSQKKLSAALADLRKLAAGVPVLEARLAETVQHLLEAEKDEPFQIAVLEYRLELNPDDHDARFRLAYKQSEMGKAAIALRHYYKIPNNDRDAMTWNNIGAAADQLELPAKAVTAYRKSAKMGESLAMSNLGSKLANAGFLDLAREQSDEAVKKPNANVGHLVSTLASFEENEQTRQSELIETVESQISHLQRLGKAAIQETPNTIAENWIGPDCPIKLKRSGNRLTMNGTYEREDSILGLLAPIGGLGEVTGSARPKTKYSISYSGQIRGNAIIGEMKHERAGATLLGSAGSKKVSMILSDDGTELSIYEDDGTGVPTTLKRVTASSLP